MKCRWLHSVIVTLPSDSATHVCVMVWWQQVQNQLGASQQFCQYMHQDPVKVVSFLFECSQRRWGNSPDELMSADCKIPDEASDVVDEGFAHFSDVYSEGFFDVHADVSFDCETP